MCFDNHAESVVEFIRAGQIPLGHGFNPGQENSHAAWQKKRKEINKN